MSCSSQAQLQLHLTCDKKRQSHCVKVATKCEPQSPQHACPIYATTWTHSSLLPSSAVKWYSILKKSGFKVYQAKCVVTLLLGEEGTRKHTGHADATHCGANHNVGFRDGFLCLIPRTSYLLWYLVMTLHEPDSHVNTKPFVWPAHYVSTIFIILFYIHFPLRLWRLTFVSVKSVFVLSLRAF